MQTHPLFQLYSIDPPYLFTSRFFGLPNYRKFHHSIKSELNTFTECMHTRLQRKKSPRVKL